MEPRQQTITQAVDEYFEVTEMHPSIDKKKQLVGMISKLLDNQIAEARREIGKDIFAELPEWQFEDGEKVKDFLRQWFAIEWHEDALQHQD